MRIPRMALPVAVVAAAALAAPAATAAPTAHTKTSPTPATTRARPAALPAADTRTVDAAKLAKLPLAGTGKPPETSRPSVAAKRAPKVAAAAVDSPPVGTVRQWFALDDVEGSYYFKDFTLRSVGANIEVWVANDTDFPAGDCRNDRTTITDAQADYLADEFDNRILPKESAAFSVAPDRDGTNSPYVADGFDFSGAGNKTVTLVDNVRDEQYYDLDNVNGFTYIAGFFSSTISEATDRNVMTIDAYDWLHRTGATPPDDSAPGDNCKSAPARPYLYESTFAHEYQHLLESYVDPDETSWVNEGLSDFAQTLVGYVDATKPITDVDFDSHVQCLYGFLRHATPANPNPREACGPENSLTGWEDQGPAEVLADYGAAYSFMLFLYDRYGLKFMSHLHTDPLNGLESLTDSLHSFGKNDTAQDVLHDWAAMLALDGALDRSGTAYNSLKRRYSSASLDAAIDWSSPYAYNTPGAPANGSDYVRLRDAAGTFLPASTVTGIEFDGAEQLEAQPVEWTVDTEAPGHEGDAAFFSGAGNNFDRAIITPVSVPTASPTLSFDTQWSTEPLWDFGFVQVSTDGGKTFTSLANADTTAEHDPGAISAVVANLPGFTGESDGWRSESFDLSAYAGKDVLLSFRYVTDSSAAGQGFWVDNVVVGGVTVADGTSLAGWKTAAQLNPVAVAGFTVQVVGYDSGGDTVDRVQMKLEKGFTGTLSGGKVRSLFGPSVDTIGAIVTYDEPTESVSQQARYSLKVNGVLQPGG